MAEPTSILTFTELVAEVAYYLGLHDTDGTGNYVAPADTADLMLCKNLVNKAVRMFVHDAPQSGWRWTKSMASVVLWPSVALGTATVSGGAFAGGLTTLTSTAASFYPSMELKTIVVTGIGSFKINSYVSSTQVVVVGNASAAVAKTFSIAADGNYTLPDTFGGQVTGEPIYAANTNQGTVASWTDESVIRSMRANTVSSGTPYLMAYRVKDTLATGSARRRWELLTWWTPGDVVTVEFPYLILFDKFVNTTDVSPAPAAHDETIKAACIAYAEKDVEKVTDGPGMTYYQKTLSNSYRIDGLAAPRRLGSFSGGSAGIDRDWRNNVPGPTVGFNQ